MEKYESKQDTIERPAAAIYPLISDFRSFTPILQDKVEGWQATEDSCSFRVKGFGVTLKITERDLNKMVKVEADDGTPFNFIVWFQLHEVGPTDTRIRLVLHAKLNMMMKMMVGSRIKPALDKVVEQIAAGFNTAPNATLDGI